MPTTAAAKIENRKCNCFYLPNSEGLIRQEKNTSKEQSRQSNHHVHLHFPFVAFSSTLSIALTSALGSPAL
jgi:hypothetical protein